MSNIKAIFVILITALLMFLCASEINNGNSFLIFLMPLIGIGNRKYLDYNNKLTNKQKTFVEVFFVVSVISFMIYISIK